MKDIEKKAALVRKWSLISTTAAGSGHPTSCLSAADIMTVLFDKYYAYDLKNPHNPDNDRLIFSKGHAAPLLYTLYAIAGGLPLEELKTLRKFGSRLEGHPTSAFPFTEAATGSLGQGLSVGAGMAYVAQKEKRNFKTYVLMGDSELAEGSVWEAANFAYYYKLHNLIAIADINRLGQSQETMFGHHMQEYIDRFSGFGWEVLAIDGHDMQEVDSALKLATRNKSGKPFIIIAKTRKGNGISFLQDKDGWHGKPLKSEDLEKALKELGDTDDALRFTLQKVSKVGKGSKESKGEVLAGTSYKLGEQHATREVYGEVLAKLGTTDETIYALDGETKNSTFAETFLKAHPNRYIECFIAEQNMASVALGLSRLGKKPFVSTFAAFLTRAYDQIRMAALSDGNIKFVGSHAGVSIGEDGASQMALEDIAMFGAIPHVVVLHPSDAVSTAKLVEALVKHSGISFLRTLRPKTPVIYTASEKFVIGGSKTLKSSASDVLTIAATGITVFEALSAYETLKKAGILVRVIDCYSLSPIDQNSLKKAVKETKKNIVITVEDHYAHGGLGDFVLDALSKTGAVVEKLAVTKKPKSGLKDELLDYEEISAKYIIKKVKSLL